MGVIKTEIQNKRKDLDEIRLDMAIKGATQWHIDATIKDIEKRRQREDEAAAPKERPARVAGHGAEGEAPNDDFALPSKTRNNYIECGGCQ
jgi:hypothetical protein